MQMRILLIPIFLMNLLPLTTATPVPVLSKCLLYSQMATAPLVVQEMLGTPLIRTPMNCRRHTRNFYNPIPVPSYKHHSLYLYPSCLSTATRALKQLVMMMYRSKKLVYFAHSSCIVLHPSRYYSPCLRTHSVTSFAPNPVAPALSSHTGPAISMCANGFFLLTNSVRKSPAVIAPP